MKKRYRSVIHFKLIFQSVDFCQVREASPSRYGGRCNGTDNPPTVIVSPGDHLKEEYMMEDEDYEHRTHSPPAVLFDE